MDKATQQAHAEKVEATIREERDRLVAGLRRLAERIEQAPLERISSGIAWIATAAEMLLRAVERALGRDRQAPTSETPHGSQPGDTPRSTEPPSANPH